MDILINSVDRRQKNKNKNFQKKFMGNPLYNVR